MRRILFVLISILFIFQLSANEFNESLVPDTNEYAVYVDALDYGPAVSKIVFKVKKQLTPEQIKAEDFELTASLNFDSFLEGFSLKSYDKKITDAYLSDEKGNRILQNSQYVTLVCYCHPDYELTSPLNSSMLSKNKFFYNYKIENERLDIKVKKNKGFVCPPAARFKMETETYLETNLNNPSKKDAVNYSYSYYIPKTDKKIPLIVWLHGITEGGNNPYLSLLGIRSTALASDTIQGYFENGVAVLVPQCPGSWLETTTLDPLGNRIWAPVDIKSYTSKITNPLDSFLNRFSDEPLETPEPEECISYYTNTLKQLIDDFIKRNPAIDKNRIYIGGCSAGGFMTLNMILQYKDYFAAAFPVCPAFPDSRISSGDIKYLAKIPVHFTWAQSDKTLNPDKYAGATVKRIIKVNPNFNNFTVFPEVKDETGQIQTEDGSSYIFSGHLSWIYVLNPQTKTEAAEIFRWLSEQNLNKK